MKRIVMFVMVLMLIFTASAAVNSPTLNAMVQTNPVIPFELAANVEEGIALNPIYELFGERIAATFSVWEALDMEVTENWGLVEFKFIQDFTAADTVIAVFDNGEEVTVLFLEYEDGVFPIDFMLVPNGFNRMYVVSDYDG